MAREEALQYSRLKLSSNENLRKKISIMRIIREMVKSVSESSYNV